MSSAARILIFSEREETRRDLSNKLRSLSYHLEFISAGGNVLEAARNSPPHILILDAGDDSAAALDIVKSLKRDDATARILIVLIVGKNAESLQINAYMAGVDAVLERPFPDVQLIVHLALLGRLATMQRELRRRAETADMYGLDSPDHIELPLDLSDAKILLIGTGDDATAPVRSLLGNDFKVDELDGDQDAVAFLDEHRHDGLVVVINSDNLSLLDLCAEFRRNPRLFNVPIVLVTNKDDLVDPALPYECGVTSVIDHSNISKQLVMQLGALIAHHRHRWAILDMYNSARAPAITDNLTGLFSYSFFHDHLKVGLSEAENTGKDLTVGFFKVLGLAELNADQGYAAGDRLISQIGGMIGSLVRREDLAARYSGAEFCVLLPDTGPEAAVNVIWRIDSIINQTEFSVAEGEPPMAAQVSTAWGNYENEETPTSLVHRVRKMLI